MEKGRGIEDLFSGKTGRNEMIKVILVDDYRHTREWCARVLRESGRYEVVASFSNASNAALACLRNPVDLVVMDVCTEDGASGLTNAEKIKKIHPETRIVIMTSMPECSFQKRARAVGCESFWYKDMGEVEFLDILDRTMMGESVYPEMVPTVRVGNADSGEFTERELEIIRELVLGKAYQEIAVDMNLSVNTVKEHIKHIYAKTGYTKSLQVVVDAVGHKLILPEF